MNGLDIALFALLFFFFIRGIFRGFVKEVAGIAGLVAGFAVASLYFTVLSDYLKPFLQNPAYRHAVAFLILFIFFFMLVGLIGLVLDKLVKLTVSVVTNGLLGAVVGLLKGIVLAAVILMVVTAFVRSDTPFFKDSLTWPYLQIIANSLKEIAPADLKKAIENKPEFRPEDMTPNLPGLPPLGGDNAEEPPWKPAKPKSGEPAPPAWPGTSDR